MCIRDSTYSIRDKAIFYQAPSIALFGAYNERTVDFDDHILTLDMKPNVEAIVKDAFMQHIPYSADNASSALHSMFENSLGMSAAEGYDVKPEYDQLLPIIEGDKSIPENWSGDPEDIDMDAWEEYSLSLIHI